MSSVKPFRCCEKWYTNKMIDVLSIETSGRGSNKVDSFEAGWRWGKGVKFYFPIYHKLQSIIPTRIGPGIWTSRTQFLSSRHIPVKNTKAGFAKIHLWGFYCNVFPIIGMMWARRLTDLQAFFLLPSLFNSF